MKTNKYLILLLSSLTLLSGCQTIFLNKSDGEVIDITSESNSESTSESENNSTLEVIDITLYDNSTYDIGDIYDIDSNITYVVTYSDNSTSNTLPEGAILRKYDLISNSTGEKLDTSIPFSKVDTYSSKWRVTYDGYVYGPNDLEENNISISVRSGFDNPDAVIDNISVFDTTKVKEGYKYIDIFNYEITIDWIDMGKEIITYNKANIQTYEEISLDLIKVGGSDNVINSPLEADEEYIPTIKINKNGLFSKSLNLFKVYHGSYVLENPEFTASDISISLLDNEINMNYTKAVGDLNILVVPVKLKTFTETSHIDDMDDSIIDKLNSYFFDNVDNSTLSVKEYFEEASFGNIHIGGVVAPIYEEKEIMTEYASLKVEIPELQDKQFPVGLYQIFTGALNNAYKNLDVDWSKYDLDHDNKLDCVHFVTNYKDADWGTTFWPQFGYKLDNVSIVGKFSKEVLSSSLPFYQYRNELNSIQGSIYAMHTIQSLVDSSIAIHEQGHVFGLQDYYDYGGSSDYVGQADMQSLAYFDYNSFSKLSLGWGKPIIVDGSQDEITLTINSASISGDSIIIPANIDTYNDSAFDEYFMLELFTKDGNNVSSWDKYEVDYGVSLGNGGIRLYHVDARIVGCNSSEFLTGGAWYEVNNLEGNKTDSDKVIDNYTVGANNSNPYTSYAGYPYSNYSNYKLLTLIQAGGVNTFGVNGQRKFLNESDFFKTGDVFTFENAKEFLLKNNALASTMDNGESWNYKIEFIDVNSVNATIKISKI